MSINKSNNKLLKTAKTVIFNEKNGRVLLVKTPEGFWDFPGGHLSSKDKSLQDCAVREIKEETGLRVKHLTLIGGTHIKEKLRHIFIATTSGRTNVRLSREHTDFKWVKLHHFDLTKANAKPKAIELYTAFKEKIKQPISTQRKQRTTRGNAIKLAA